MNLEEQVKVLCVRSHVSAAELARRVGKSPQAFHSKLKLQSFTIAELEQIADTLGCTFERAFVLPNGEKI